MKKTHTSRIIEIDHAQMKLADAINSDEPSIFHLPNGWDRLEEAIDASPLKQNEIADLCGISPVTFSRWKKAKNGHLPESAIPFILLAKHLNVSMDWLFYLDTEGSNFTSEELQLIQAVSSLLQEKGKKKAPKPKSK